MRRRIRLSGRRQLPNSCVSVTLEAENDEQFLVLHLLDKQAFASFPANAKVRLKLNENKKVEIIDYGTIGSMAKKVKLPSTAFEDPGCQLRIVENNDENKGVILGSTKEWRLETHKYPENENVRGILQFLPGDISPRTWKLEFKDDDHPIIMVDKRIPDARSWARSNPIFLATALPTIVQLVFTEILRNPAATDIEWMSDWLRWAESLMPGEPIELEEEESIKKDWIEQLVDTFCSRHEFSDVLVDKLTKDEEP